MVTEKWYETEKSPCNFFSLLLPMSGASGGIIVTITEAPPDV
jgi:hypothetical protein